MSLRCLLTSPNAASGPKTDGGGQVRRAAFSIEVGAKASARLAPPRSSGSYLRDCVYFPVSLNQSREPFWLDPTPVKGWRIARPGKNAGSALLSRGHPVMGSVLILKEIRRGVRSANVRPGWVTYQLESRGLKRRDGPSPSAMRLARNSLAMCRSENRVTRTASNKTKTVARRAAV